MHVEELPKFSQLFHRLNNQLGIILANAELLEAKAADEKSRTRAAQIVMGVIEALSTAKAIRSKLKTPE